MPRLQRHAATQATAQQIAERVRGRELSAQQAVTEALQRISARDEGINAFAVVRGDRALAEASEVDQRGDRDTLPLAGVPIAIKDNVPVSGEPMRIGSATTSPDEQTEDHPVVQRIRAAGGVIVGLTRVPEFCVFGATDSVFGVTRNPWNLGRSPGGSSGGSAAAVAAGMVPLAHGNDGMGSIRIPAACTGLVGIKPGRFVVPAQLGATDWFGMAENGPLAMNVADAALLLSVMADRPELARITVPQRIRIAYSTRRPVVGVPLDTGWAAAVERAAGAARSLGHDVRKDNPVYPTGAAVAGIARWFAGAAADADDSSRIGVSSSRTEPQLEPRVQRHAALGRAILKRQRLRDWALGEELRDAWIARAGEFLTQYDVLLTPALARPPLESRRWHEASWLVNMAVNTAYAPFAAPWNVAGFPAIVIPVGLHPTSGTPVAVQLVARPGREDLLIGVAAALEAALSDAGFWPPRMLDETPVLR